MFTIQLITFFGDTERRGIEGSEGKFSVYSTTNALNTSIISVNHSPPLTEEAILTSIPEYL